MSVEAGRQYTPFAGINLKARNGVIRFETPTVAPSITSGHRLLYTNASNELIWNDGSTETTLGSSGGVVDFDLNDAYDDGRTITADAGAVTINSSGTGGGLDITDTGSGVRLNLAGAGTGNDITGVNWSVTHAGAIDAVGVTGDTLTVGDGASAGVIASSGNFNVTLQTGNGTTSDITIVDGANGDVDITLDGTGAVNINGTTAGNDSLVVAAGDVSTTDGSVTIVDADNAASLAVTNNTASTVGAAATGGVVQIVSTSLTTGAAVNVSLTEGTLAGGFYYSAWDDTAGARVFSVGEDGATTITGTGGSDVLSITAGDINVADGGATFVDADNAVTLSVTNNTATTSDVVQLTGSGTFTGVDASAFVAVTQSGLTTGDAVSITTDAMTTGTALKLDSSGTMVTTGALLEGLADSATTAAGVYRLSADALTTGIGVLVTSTSTALAAGQLMNLDHTASGSSISAKTGQLIDIVSSRTETRTSGTTADDYDALSVIRTNVMNGAGGTLTATGSVLRLENVATQTAGTLTDTVMGLEVVMDVDGTGDGVSITHNATGGIALDVTAAATSVDGARITGTGVQANNTGTLHVTGSGATAAGGSVLRVTGTGTPAAATSYLVDLDYTGMTSTNNPDAVHIANSGTGRALHVTGSGLAAQTAPTLEIESTNAGAVGAVLSLFHQGGSQTAADVVGMITFEGEDDAAADNEYARIEAVVVAATAGSESGRLDFYAGDANGGVSVAFNATHDGTNGFISAGDGAATGIVESSGNFDLQLQTGNSTTGNITLTDGANGNITLTPNGNGQVDVANVMLYSKTQAITGSGAIDVVSSITELNTTGGGAYTLADGTEGQIKVVIMVTDSGTNAVITPTNAGGWTTHTMADAGDSVTLQFTNGNWYVIGQGGLSGGGVTA